MNTTQRLIACTILLTTATAWAAGNKSLTDAQQRYNQERSRCMSEVTSTSISMSAGWNG